MPETTVEVHVTCHRCDSNHIFELPTQAVLDYQARRRNVQECFPQLNADQRELLISRTCPPCWKALFGTDPEEEMLARLQEGEGG